MTFAEIEIHPVPGLDPEVWTVEEVRFPNGTGFFYPMLRESSLVNLDGTLAWSLTLEEAVETINEFLRRMQS